MRTTQIMTISLPPGMVKQFEKVRKVENRTRSELVREALRFYIESRFPVVEPTRAELAAIRRGRAAFTRGDYISLDKLLNDLELKGHRARAKRPAKAASKRPAAD